MNAFLANVYFWVNYCLIKSFITFQKKIKQPHLGCPSWLAGTLDWVHWLPQRYRPWPGSSILLEAGVLRSPWARCSCTGLWALSTGQSHLGFHKPPPRIPSQHCHHRKTAQTRTKPESERRGDTPQDRRPEAEAGLDKTHKVTYQSSNCYTVYLIIPEMSVECTIYVFILGVQCLD